MAKTVPDLIEALGGPAGIAAAINYDTGAIRLWKHRKVIPRRAWPDLLAAFPHLISMNDLRAAEPPKRERAA